MTRKVEKKPNSQPRAEEGGQSFKLMFGTERGKMQKIQIKKTGGNSLPILEIKSKITK